MEEKQFIPQKENKLGTMPITKLVVQISLPLMVSMLVQSLYNIVDGIFVAQISKNALTATSLAFPAQLLMIAISVGTGVGINSLLARNLGKKKYEEANAAAINGLFLAVSCSLVFIILGIFCVPAFFRLFTQDQEITALGIEYLQICMVFSTGIFIATTGERLLQATGNTSLSMLAQIIGAVTNIILDPIMIFGWFGLPAMGIRGAAYATVIGQWLAAISSLILNQMKNKEIQLVFKGFRPNLSVIGAIYKVGVPTMLVQAAGSVMLVGMNRILLLSSTTAVMVFGVYYKLQSFVFMPVQGLAQGLIPIVGYNYGAKNGKRVMEACKVTGLIGIGIMAIGTTLFLAAPQQLLGMFDANEEMLAIGVPALRLIAPIFIPASITISIGYALSGMGNGLVSMVSTLIRQLVVLLPCAIVFSRVFGFNATWYAFWIAELIAVAYAIQRFIHAYRVKIKALCTQETPL